MTQPVRNPNLNDESDLKRILDLFTRNWKLFTISIAAALMLAFAANRFILPEYRITASLLIKEGTQQQQPNVNEFINQNLFGVNQNFQNELWLLKSTPVMEQTIRNLDLTVTYLHKKGFQYEDGYGIVPFRVVMLRSHPQPVDVRFHLMILDRQSFQIKAKAKEVFLYDFEKAEVTETLSDWSYGTTGQFGKLIETGEMAFIVYLETARRTFVKNDFSYAFAFHDEATLCTQLQKKLEFNVIDKKATVIEIACEAPSVKKGRDIVDELMTVYGQQNLDRKNHIAEITINYIERQLGEISDSLSLAENSLQRFRSSNQLLNSTEQATGISAQYMDLQNQMAELVTRKRYYDYVAEYLTKNENFSNMIVPASMGINDPLLNTLMTELIAAESQRSNLIRNNQERNPMVQKLTIQIENSKKAITENISAVQKTTEITLEEMDKRIRRVEAQISKLPKTQQQLGGIERKYRLNDAIYNYLLEKRAEAKITQASNLPDNIVIEPARMYGTKPVSPNHQMNYLIALFLGVGLPFGFLTLRNAMGNKIESQEQIERITDVPVVGKIMHNHRKTVNVMHEFPKSTLAESFRALRTHLEFNYRGTSHKVLLVTSSIEGEGKTFTALNLAMAYAQLGRRALLIDFDLRKPVSYFLKSKEKQEGLSSWYTGKVNLEEIISKSPHEQLDFIQSGALPPNPLEMLASEKTGELLSEMRKRYDIIVLDTTPLAQVSDAYMLMDHADINLVIVRSNYTLRKAFAFVMKDLKSKQINHTSVILNDNRVYADQYGYGYGYAKGKK